MARRRKCAFNGCNNRVMKSTYKNRLLSVCRECFDNKVPYMFMPVSKEERVCEQCGTNEDVIPDADCLSYHCRDCTLKLCGND